MNIINWYETLPVLIETKSVAYNPTSNPLNPEIFVCRSYDCKDCPVYHQNQCQLELQQGRIKSILNQLIEDYPELFI